jgi:flagellar hook-associated protein 2
MATITAAGSGSGLNIESIVTQLIAVQRAPVENRLNSQQALAQATLTGFGTLNSALADFQKTIEGLQKLADFQGRLVSSSDNLLFIATGTNEAAVSTTSIEVIQLAKAHKLISADFTSASTPVGTGTLTLSANSKTFQLNITDTDQSLEKIRDRINNDENNFGITASILTVDDGSGGTVSKLVLTADGTGEGNAISISVDDDDGGDKDSTGLSQLFFISGDAENQLTEKDSAQDAQILIDGFTASSSTNLFANAIQGITITAVKEDVGNPGTLSVTLDKFGSEAKIRSFVNKYNNLISNLNQLTDFDADTNTAGLLTGDATARGIETQVRRIINATVTGGGAFKSLAELGLRTERDGTLTIDSTVLDKALADNFEDVGKVFTDETGISKKLDELIDTFIDNSTGLIKTRTDGLDKTLDDIAVRRAALERRLDSVEQRLRSQFIAMDLLVAQLNSTGSFLIQQLDLSTNIVRNFGQSSR